MARPLRIEFAGARYHVTARGNAGEDIYADNDDRFVFLCLTSAVTRRVPYSKMVFKLTQSAKKRTEENQRF